MNNIAEKTERVHRSGENLNQVNLLHNRLNTEKTKGEIASGWEPRGKMKNKDGLLKLAIDNGMIDLSHVQEQMEMAER